MKHSRMSVQTLKLIAAGMFVFIVYLAMSSPGDLVVSARGEIIGIVNVARAQLQGKRFWREQLREAKSDLEWNKAAPQREAERNARHVELIERTDRRMDEFYERYPKARPSPAEQRAEALREEADRIERAELDEQLEKRRLARISKIEEVIQILESRSQ